MQNQLIEILMAEDSPTDQMIAEEVIKSSKILNRLHCVSNGEDLLAFLRREEPYKNVPVPDLILLDLNMPRKSGLETLEELKQHPQWKRIPVIILTASQAETDVVAAYSRHANCFIVKPVDFDQFIHVVRSIENFWFGVVRLPPKAVP